MAVAKAVVKKSVVSSGYQIVDIDTIEFMPSGRGGGRAMDPATATLIEHALKLKIGQGFKVPASLRIQREINGVNGKSVLYTYKGAPALSRRAKTQNMRYRTRRDTAGNLWLFRATPLEVSEAVVE